MSATIRLSNNICVIDRSGIMQLSEMPYKIAGFDLDHTLIRPNGKHKFAKNKNDWILMYNNVKQNLIKYIQHDYKIVIFSNQTGKVVQQDLIEKCTNIANLLDIPIIFYLATHDDINKKPRIGMWHYMINTKYPNIDKSKSFYCGDALGNLGDFADIDLKFALNIGIKIITPDQIFYNVNDPIDLNNIDNVDLIDNIKFHPLVYFKNNSGRVTPPVELKQELIILVGPMASGKTTYAHNYPTNKCVISLDKFTTKTQFVKKIQKEIYEYNKHGNTIIIDCTNRDIKTRKQWINMCLSNSNIFIRCVFINIPKHVSMHLNTFRRLTSDKNIPDVAISMYYKYLEIPTLTEGFNAIDIIPFNYNSDINSDTLLTQYLRK